MYALNKFLEGTFWILQGWVSTTPISHNDTNTIDWNDIPRAEIETLKDFSIPLVSYPPSCRNV